MKYLFNSLIAALTLFTLSPLLVFIVVLIYLFEGWPIFFLQHRAGFKGKAFTLVKFRTMKKRDISKSGTFDVGKQSLVTPIGKILRRTKIDELPQFYNVLKGDMSIVGPRPEVKQWTEVYPEKWKIVHSVKPGITDNASIEFRNEEEILSNSEDPIATYRDVILPRKLDLYIDYVNNRSFWGDIKIIFKTIKVVVLK